MAGYVFPILRFAYGTAQSTDQRGRVSAKVRHSLVHLTAAVPEHSFLLHWASDPHKRLPAQLILREAGRAIETVLFAGAYCVSYAEAFESGDEHLGSYICHFTLSDPDGWTWQVGGPTAYVAPAVKVFEKQPILPLADSIPLATWVGKKNDLPSWTEEHKAARWAEYQRDKAGDPQGYSKERWDRAYERALNNNINGLGREHEYALAMGGESRVFKTRYTLRQIDVYIERPGEKYCGQIKSGPICLRHQEKIDLKKDKWLVDNGYDVEYILERGASKPMLEGLKKIGATYKIGPQIP